MANSAFDHTAAITLPGSSTNTALVRWSGTGADTLTDSTILVGATTMGLAADTDLLTFSNGTLTIGGTLAATTLTGAGSGITGLNASNLGSGTVPTARLGTGTANNSVFLRGDGTWAAAGGTTINNNADNRVITGSGTADTLEGEANLTFDGTGSLTLNNSAANSSSNIMAYSSVTSGTGSPARLILRTAAGNTADTYMSFHGVDSYEYSVGVDNSDSDKFKISGSALGTNDRFVLQSNGNLDLIKSGGTSTENSHLKFKHNNTNTGLTTLPNTGHVTSPSSVTADTYCEISPLWYASGGGTSYKNFSSGKTGSYHIDWITDFWTTQASNQGACSTIMMRSHNGSNGDLTYNSSANILAIGYYDGSSAARSFFFRADGTGYADSSWTTFSDNRLKFNQEVVPYGLDTIMQLQPKVYDKYSGAIEDGVVTLEDASARREIGFIAQEIKALVPEIVPTNADENNGWYALEDGKLMAVVVKAIQELKAEIDELKG